MTVRSRILQRFVDQAAQESDIDPRTEVHTHWGGDPEKVITAWENDRAYLVAKLDSARTAAGRYREDRDNAWADLENR